MAGHEHIQYFLGAGCTNTSTSSPKAWENIVCGHCGRDTTSAVIATSSLTSENVSWLRCPSCQSGTVISDGVQYPGPRTGGEVAGLPENVEIAYNEARDCIRANAFTATEMMCRKILMHIAVDKGAKPGENFASYLRFLSDNGYVTPPMAPWVDAIRKHGNVAVHELPETDQDRAMGTLIFTEQLLRMVYGMEHLAAKFAPKS